VKFSRRETKLIDSEKLTVGFTGAPLLANGKVIIGSQGGEWPYRGPIFGVDAATGKLTWTFFTVTATTRTIRRAKPGAAIRGRPVVAAAGWRVVTIR
jgi:outer membrane protein assembly factor BamB